MALGILGLVTGLVAGVARMGWLNLTPPHTQWHGPLMVSGFLGTVISLERAIATGKRWAYAAPVLTGVGALTLVGILPWKLAAGLILAGSVVATLTFVSLLRTHRSWSLVIMGAGAACWAASNAAWVLGAPLYKLVPAWQCFLALTILGERLQLSRMVIVSRRARPLFATIIGVIVIGAAAGMVAYDLGARVVGVGFVLATLWLAKYDMARRTVRASGVPRFSAVCLLIGYGWLGVAGVLWVVFGGWVGVLRYDAVLHSFFLGFVMSMILGHAPVIFPTVLGITMRFHRGFYVPVILLHATLAMRVLGDLIVWVPGWRYGGLSNAVAVVLFFVIVVTASRPARSQAPSADAR
jgi:hypothetical protein